MAAAEDSRKRKGVQQPVGGSKELQKALLGVYPALLIAFYPSLLALSNEAGPPAPFNELCTPFIKFTMLGSDGAEFRLGTQVEHIASVATMGVKGELQKEWTKQWVAKCKEGQEAAINLKEVAKRTS